MSAKRARAAVSRAEPISEAELDALLRTHHKNTLQGSVDLSCIDDLVAQVFAYLVGEAHVLETSPLTKHMANHFVLRHARLPTALGHALAGKVCEGGVFAGSTAADFDALKGAFVATFIDTISAPAVMSSVLADLAKAWIADPATQGLFQPIFFFKGFQAITLYRVAHRLWTLGDACSRGAALLLQSRMAELFAVDIHPAATIGDGVMLDHASGIVIGSTAILGNDVYMLHSTTLGATGKPMGAARRHPKIGSSCTIGAGCTVLGDLTVGDKATIGAAAVVTKDVPVSGTVIGVNNLLKRKAPAPKLSASMIARRLNSEQREAFEARMDAQASAALQEESAAQHPSVVVSPSPAVGSATERSLSVESGTYDFYGETGTLEDLTWMYDRKAVEFVVRTEEDIEEEQGTYDMFF